MSKRLSKYIAAFDYFDKSLILFLAASYDVSVASFVSAIDAPVGITNASFSLAFLLTTRITKKL